MDQTTWAQLALVLTDIRRCNECGKIKPTEQFHRRSGERGYRSQCVACARAKMADRYRRSRDLTRGTWKHRLIEKDPLTMRGVCAHCGPVQLRWKTLLRGESRRHLRCGVAVADQKGRSRRVPSIRDVEGRRLRREAGACQLCGSDAGLVVDHCHRTGTIRGVLCRACNWGLGQFRDRPDLLRRAADYLEARTAA